MNSLVFSVTAVLGILLLPLALVTEPAPSHTRLTVSFASPRKYPADHGEIVGRVLHSRAPTYTSLYPSRCVYLLVGGGGNGGGTASDDDPLRKTLRCKNLSLTLTAPK